MVGLQTARRGWVRIPSRCPLVLTHDYRRQRRRRVQTFRRAGREDREATEEERGRYETRDHFRACCIRAEAAEGTPLTKDLTDGELNLIYQQDQPSGIRDRGGYLFFFTRISRYDGQEERYREEVAQRIRLADFLLQALIGAAAHEPSVDVWEAKMLGTAPVPLVASSEPSVTRLPVPGTKLTRLSDIADTLVRELRRQGMETLQAVFDGVKVRVEPWKEPLESGAPRGEAGDRAGPLVSPQPCPGFVTRPDGTRTYCGSGKGHPGTCCCVEIRDAEKSSCSHCVPGKCSE